MPCDEAILPQMTADPTSEHKTPAGSPRKYDRPALHSKQSGAVLSVFPAPEGPCFQNAVGAFPAVGRLFAAVLKPPPSVI